MEFLLLWVDDLDDALGALRHLAPKIIGFLFALSLFAGTAVVLTRIPNSALLAIACALSASLFERFRRRRLRSAHDRS